VRTFAFRQEEMPQEIKPWKAVQDISEDVVSTGNEELDQLIGGVKKGSIIAIEVGGNVPSYYIDNIKVGIISNFAAQGRGVAFLPSKRAPAEIVAGQIAPYLGEETYNKYVRVFEALQLESFVGAENAIALDGGDVAEDLKWKKIEFSLQDSKHPYLSILSFDTLESMYGGGELIEGLTAHLTSIRRDKDIFVGILVPTDESIGKLANVAHTHLKIENIDGSVVLYGEKPFTELFALSFDVSKGYPKTNLTPIV
jgi:hypothetical protein